MNYCSNYINTYSTDWYSFLDEDGSWDRIRELVNKTVPTTPKQKTSNSAETHPDAERSRR